MGLKVAGVSLLCQDKRVFDAMWSAGTPCPFGGKIGAQAKALWLAKPAEAPKGTKIRIAAAKKAEELEQKRLEEEGDNSNYNNETRDTWPPEE